MQSQPLFDHDDPDVDIWPILKYHYGFTIAELLSTPRIILLKFLEKIPEIIAQNELMLIRASSFPHAKQSHQRQVINELTSAASGPKGKQIIKPRNIEDHNMMAQLSGIAFEVVD